MYIIIIPRTHSLLTPVSSYLRKTLYVSPSGFLHAVLRLLSPVLNFKIQVFLENSLHIASRYLGRVDHPLEKASGLRYISLLDLL